MISSKTNII